MGDDLNFVRRRLSKYIESGQAIVVAAPSTVGASLVQDQSLDLAFLDGDHSEEALAADIRAWAPKVKSGGVLAGHDYQPVQTWGDGEGERSAASPDDLRKGPRGVVAAVNAALPEGAILHIAPNMVWWW